MSYSIWFLTATFLASGAPDVSKAPAPVSTKAPATTSSSADPCCNEENGWTRFCGRVRHFFHRDKCATTPCCETVRTVSTPAPPVAPAAPREPEIKPVAARSPYAQRDVAKEYLGKIGRADDFQWVTGQLFYVHIHGDGGLWVVRYAPLDREDRFGGSVVLAAATSMEGFREGDLVTVHGEMLNEGRASRYLGGPLYRANAVNLNQRLAH